MTADLFEANGKPYGEAIRKAREWRNADADRQLDAREVSS